MIFMTILHCNKTAWPISLLECAETLRSQCFITECNFKLLLLVVILFAMTVGILCLIIVVSGIRDQQRSLVQRITTLEKELGFDGVDYESLYDGSKLNEHDDPVRNLTVFP